MVLTTPLAPGLAIQVAEPLTATDQEVASVGATLAALSAVGVLVATLLGWAVARTGLAPVARLASVAEEVTLTGDPGRRVEVGRRDELGRLATSFNAMLSALQRSLDAQRRLVSDASHELRTPLASLRINVDVLRGAPGHAGRRARRRCSPGSPTRSRSSAAWSPASPTWPGASRRRRSGRRSGSTPSPPTPWTRPGGTGRRPSSTPTWPAASVDGSADRLRVAVKNLLDNAAKFGPPEGPVEVRLADGELTVRDHGPGIDRRRPAVRLRPLLPCAVVPVGARLRPRPRRRPRDRRSATAAR